MRSLFSMRGAVVVVSFVVALVLVGQGAAAGPPWHGRYTVRAGDSFSAVARRYGVSVQALAAGNGLDWRQPLLIGVVLRVPLRSSAPGLRGGVYVVRAGDTLIGIAVHYRVSLGRLAAANGIDPAGVLPVGARLRIPAALGSTLDLARVVESDPYRRGAVGYDVSFPNCATPVLGGHAFAVVGLNAGRPFTINRCFASEWARALAPASVYVNTGYSRTFARHLTPACRAAGQSQPLGVAGRRAYAIGCSEAVVTERLLAGRQALAIWLDVESSNTWSLRPSLNRATIRGILDRLAGRSTHPLIGIYSNAAFWRQITGGWSSLSVPEWAATTAGGPSGCRSSFAGGPVWLSQSSDGRLDRDTVC